MGNTMRLFNKPETKNPNPPVDKDKIPPTKKYEQFINDHRQYWPALGF